MSEESVVGAPASDEAEVVSAGTLLRRAREASGLHVAALAVAMKVPVKKLEALEADRLQDLPDAVFVRALAASVCRALKVDPSPILSKLPQSVTPRIDTEERSINTPFRSRSPNYGGNLKALLLKPSTLVVLALLLAAVVVLFFPESHNQEKAAVLPAETPALVQSPAPATPQAEAVQAPSVPATVSVPASAPVVVAAPAVVASTAAPAAVAASNPVQQASAAAAKVWPTVVAFKAHGAAWVRVSDAKGVVQFEKTLQSGESAVAGGELPLSVVVGNVSATEVEVRGQPFGLDTVNKNNVARFEVK